MIASVNDAVVVDVNDAVVVVVPAADIADPLDAVIDCSDALKGMTKLFGIVLMNFTK